MLHLKKIVGHAFFVDSNGEKMSKSKGNITTPESIYKKYGADVLRLWLSSTDFKKKMTVSEEIHEQTAIAYRKIRNVSRFMLQNLQDFDPKVNSVDYDNLRPVDQYVINSLYKLVKNVENNFENWDFHLFYSNVYNFCVDLSSFYLDIIKDVLYTYPPDSLDRRSIQTTLWELLINLSKILAPVLTFTSEEIWQHCRLISKDLSESVQLESWPQLDERFKNKEIEEKWNVVLELREKILEKIEESKKLEIINNPIETKVEIHTDEKTKLLLEKISDDLSSIFSVSQVYIEIGDNIDVFPADGEKCERCWKKDNSVRENEFSICKRCSQNLDIIKGKQK